MTDDDILKLRYLVTCIGSATLEKNNATCVQLERNRVKIRGDVDKALDILGGTRDDEGEGETK